MRAALPAKSPTVVLIWATAIFIGWRASRERTAGTARGADRIEPRHYKSAALARVRPPPRFAGRRPRRGLGRAARRQPHARPRLPRQPAPHGLRLPGHGLVAAVPHAVGRAGAGRRRAALREVPLVRRVRLRLGLGRRLRAPRTRVLPEAARGRALHARDGPAPAGGVRRRSRHARRRPARPRAAPGGVVAARALPDAGRRPHPARRGIPRARRRPVPLAQRRLRDRSTTSSPRCRTTSARRSARNGARWPRRASRCAGQRGARRARRTGTSSRRATAAPTASTAPRRTSPASSSG